VTGSKDAAKREAVGIGRDGLEQALQGDGAIELRVASPVHLTHPTGADGLDDLVRAQAGSGGQAHGEVIAGRLVELLETGFVEGR